ncbi:MAG: transposase [Flavobacteriales bacterium]|nr:transposase [Flavobacteriales bacterium]
MIPKGVFLDKVDIWFEDESRIGQKGTLSRIWAQKGTRPRVVRQQQYLYQYIFGAVCPKLGIGAAIVAPNVNIETMQKILEEISLHVQKGRRAVVVLDQAGWHVSNSKQPIPFAFTSLCSRAQSSRKRMESSQRQISL